MGPCAFLRGALFTAGPYIHTLHLSDAVSPFSSCYSAPDTTRDFARIGDFLKSSGGGAQGGGGAEKGRPQTQAGSYKVVAPWER